MESQPAPSGLDPDAILAEMAQEGAQPVGFNGHPVSETYDRLRTRVQAQVEAGTHKHTLGRVRYTHEDCVDRILACPGIREKELAMLYGVTPTWMTIVVNSDAFKAQLAARKAELVDPELAASLNERFGALARRSVDVLIEKMNKPINEISDKLAMEAAALGAKVLGMGEAKAPAGPSANDHLASLAHRLIDLNRPVSPPPAAIDVETREVN